MTNPFAAFQIEDDDEPTQTTTTKQVVKRTHQEKKQFKNEQLAKSSQPAASNVVTQALPERVKENAKEIRNNRAPPTPQTKKLGEGHYLDRRSGTGRVDKPRKEGGGKGNVGNIKDDLHPEKYIKEGQEETQVQPEGEVVAEQVKPEEPQALTLEQYYRSKGIEVTNTFEKKVPVKKTQVNAEWIKKEKLIVLQTKQDKKHLERNGQNFIKFNTGSVAKNEALEGLGFGQKAAKKPEQKKQVKPEYKHEGKGGKGKNKVVINDDDFPTL